METDRSFHRGKFAFQQLAQNRFSGYPSSAQLFVRFSDSDSGRAAVLSGFSGIPPLLFSLGLEVSLSSIGRTTDYPVSEQKYEEKSDSHTA
jgi:hypothetical protein